MLTEDAIRRLPEPIVQKLRSLIARIRRVLWWRGFWSTLAVLVVVLLAIMAVDAAFDLESTAVRCGLSLAGLAVVGWAAWRTLVRPLSRTFGLAQVARLVEIHHPEMHERISTAVELLGSTDAAGLRGSDELLAEVVKSAVVDVSTVSPESEYSSLPTRLPRRMAAAAAGTLAVILAIWPFQGGMLVARALLPFANIGSASAFDLRVITQDVAVGEGEPLTLLVAAKGRAAKRVELRRESAESASGPAAAPSTVERLMPQVSDQARPGETVFALTLPSVQDSFRYSAVSGRARTRDFFVEVQRRPDITGLRVAYTYPPYTTLPPKTDPDSLGDIAALTGTRVEVTATLSRPAATATLVYDQTENAGPPVTVATENGVPVARWSAELTSGMNYRWTLHAKGAGERLGKPASGTLRALEDLPPAVVIDSPVDRELQLRPNDVLPIVYTAADDHGFSAIDLMLRLNGKGERLISAPLPEKDPQVAQTWHGTATLDLSKLPLAGVNEVRVRLRVADTVPPNLDGPQTATAEDILIRLNWGAESFAQQTLRKQEEQLRRELEEVKNNLWDQRRQAEEKTWQLKNPEQMDGDRLRELEQLTERTAASAAQLQDIAKRAAQSAFAERADAIEQVARNQVRGATESLQEIPQSDQPQQRSASAELARNQLESAARQLDEVLNAFNQDREQGQELGELANLAREQQQLADQAAAAAPSASPSPAENTPPSSPPPNAAQDPASAPTAPQPASPSPSAAEAVAQAPTNPLTDPTATPEQRQEAFERWQQHQDSVEHRAQNVANQFQQKVPADRQSDLARLATQAEALARQAEALAQRQDEVAARAGLEPTAAPTTSSDSSPAETAAQTTASPEARSPESGSPEGGSPEGASPDSGSPAASTPQNTAQAAQHQADVAAQASQLAEAVKSLQQESRDALNQNGKAASQASEAAAALDSAAESGRQASSALAQEASQANQSSQENQAASATPPGTPAPGAPTGTDASPTPPAPGQGDSAQAPATVAGQPPGATPGTASDPSASPAPATPTPSVAGAPDSQPPTSAERSPSPTSPPTGPLTAGQQAVEQTGRSIDAAANALEAMAKALSGQAEGVATASQALASATTQTKQASDAGDAARQAGQQAARQASEQPNATRESAAAAESDARLQSLAQSAASPAQQAATNLALAAATAQAAMGLPENALSQQNMGKNGSPKPGDGQQGQSGQTAQNNQPSNQPGQKPSDQAGFQTTKDYGLPPELAKLGMSVDDWARLRGLVTSGADGSASDQVPAEYRDLVRGYFRALATGGSGSPKTDK